MGSKRKDRNRQTSTSRPWLLIVALVSMLFIQAGCMTASEYRLDADKAATTIIQEKRQQLLGSSEDFIIERPSDILRRRLMLDQELPYADDASLGTDKLKVIDHWPEKGYPTKKIASDQVVTVETGKPLKLNLVQALQVGAANSQDYQAKKEDVFKTALKLDLERNDFGFKLDGEASSSAKADYRNSSNTPPGIGGTTSGDSIKGFEHSGTLSLGKTFREGTKLAAALAVDLVSLLTQGQSSSFGITADASISIPLLRGSGRHIVTEDLTQAERDVVYAIYEFERYKKTFAVGIAKDYLGVLKQQNQVENGAENYRNLIASARRSRRLADAGRATEITVDQAVQKELNARDRWVSATEQYKNRLDSFKKFIGLSPDAAIELDRSDLDELLAPTSVIRAEIVRAEEMSAGKATPPAEAVIELIEPGREHAGPMEIDNGLALNLGLENRMDLRVALGKVFDAQRSVVVTADALGAELTLLGKADLGESRSLSSAGQDDAKLRTGKGIYTSVLTIDLPFERTVERNNYRSSYIALEQAIRGVQKLEDEIKLSILSSLRSMSQSREGVQIQTRAVIVAEKRAKSTDLFFEAGRAELRDILEAQDALLSARNALTASVVDYRVAELEFQRDTGLLAIDEKGLFKEYSPEEKQDVK